MAWRSAASFAASASLRQTMWRRPSAVTSLTNSWVSSPPARWTHKGVNGLSSASTTVRTSLSVRSRAPSTYSSPRSSSAAMVSAQIMPRSATTQTWPMAKRLRRRSITGTSTRTSAVLPGHISEHPAPGIDHHAHDHLHQVGAVVLRVAALAEALPARAGERQRGRVEEHHREFAEQVTPARKQVLLDAVLDGARGKRGRAALLVGWQLLAEPGHGAVELVQPEPVRARDVVVGEPLLAGPVRARDHDPVQHGGEHGALEGELEGAPAQQILDDGATAGLFPQPAEQERGPDARAGEPIGVAGVELREDHGALGVAGDGAGEALEGAGGGDGLLASEVLDDALLGAAALAHGLDEIEVGVAVDALLADEHAISSCLMLDFVKGNWHSAAELSITDFCR